MILDFGFEREKGWMLLEHLLTSFSDRSALQDAGLLGQIFSHTLSFFLQTNRLKRSFKSEDLLKCKPSPAVSIGIQWIV